MAAMKVRFAESRASQAYLKLTPACYLFLGSEVGAKKTTGFVAALSLLPRDYIHELITTSTAGLLTIQELAETSH
jgi:hypothetical protein